MNDLPGWRLLDHTADIRMEAVGSTLEDLFLNAAQGLATLLTPDSGSDTADRREIDVELEADAVEDLLIDWLREILFLHEAEDFALLRVETRELTEGRLKARLVGRTLQEDEEPGEEIKAVTYHALSVEKTQQGYTTRIVFDI